MALQSRSESLRAAKLVDFVIEEREKSLSSREWQHRLAGYGYSVKETEKGHVVITWPGGAEICALPQPPSQEDRP